MDSVNQPIFTANVFGSGDFVAITDLGLPIASFYGFETASSKPCRSVGFCPAQCRGRGRHFVDQNEDGVIDNEDKVVIDSLTSFTYGFGVGQLEAIRRELVLARRHGNDIYNSMFRYDLATTNLPSPLTAGQGREQADEPKSPMQAAATMHRTVSSKTGRPAGQVAQVGYTLPRTLINQLKLRQVPRVRQRGEFVDIHKLRRPRSGNRNPWPLDIGIDRALPIARIYNLGLNVTF